MNLQEAYKLLGVSEQTTDDELKSKYKSFAKTHHPDVNKAPDAEQKFKNINAAYDLIKDFRANPHKYSTNRSPFSSDFSNEYDFMYGFNIQDFINGNFGGSFRRSNQQQQEQSKTHNYKQPQVDLIISFNESVLGCSKTINYSRFIKCDNCNGLGAKTLPNDCKDCDGFGRIIKNNKNVSFQSVCQKCYGHNIKRNECKPCNNSGVIQNKVQGNIVIPSGIVNNSTLRLAGNGSFLGKDMFSNDAYGDVFINVSVKSDPEMKLINEDVFSSITIDLLSALKGCTKEINTVQGKKQLIIPPSSKNKDTIEIKGCGVANTSGSHIVELLVEYPNNIEKLISALEEQQLEKKE